MPNPRTWTAACGLVAGGQKTDPEPAPDPEPGPIFSKAVLDLSALIFWGERPDKYSMFSLKKPATASPLQPVLDTLESVILGKPEQVRLSLACVLAKGHLLVEDVPGVGKTTLVRSLAKVLGLDTKRVQFTNDLLPADILGTSIFDSTSHTFKFHPGPVFTNVLIADELNRGTPRTQSAFLQAMEER